MDLSAVGKAEINFIPSRIENVMEKYLNHASIPIIRTRAIKVINLVQISCQVCQMA